MLAFAAYTHAFRVVTGIAKGRGATRADPLVTALVTLFLFFEPLLQRLHDLVPIAQALDFFHLLVGEKFLGHSLEPIFGYVDRVLTVIAEDALEDPLEDLVEPVEQAFVLHEGGPGEVIERLGRLFDDIAIQRLDERQVFLEACGDARSAELVDEI